MVVTGFDRLTIMAQAAASALVGAPVAWKDLTPAARRVFIGVAFAVYEADRLSPDNSPGHGPRP
jgi:hypothetical protein